MAWFNTVTTAAWVMATVICLVFSRGWYAVAGIGMGIVAMDWFAQYVAHSQRRYREALEYWTGGDPDGPVSQAE